MATSLARQLKQLKTAAAVSAASAFASSISSSCPLLLDDSSRDLTESELRLIAEDAFSVLEDRCSHIGRFRGKLFDESPDNEEDASSSATSWEEQLLLLLTPFATLSHTQFLLQWMMSKHRVHVTHCEAFVWALMPHFKSRAFHRAVEAVTVVPNPNASWLATFRVSCHPATEVGLHKHIACDRGFLKLICQWMLKTLAHEKSFSEDKPNYEAVVYFFASSVASALGACYSITEHHLQHIMPVVVGCVKSSNTEFQACGATLWAAVVPRIRLSAKVANRLLKVLAKTTRKHGDGKTLAMLLILYKYQRDNLDVTKILETLLNLDKALSIVLDNPDQSSGEAAYASKVMSVLCNLCDQCLLEDGEEVEGAPELLEIVSKGLERNKPDSDAAIVLISCVSKRLAYFRDRKKKKNKSRRDCCKAILQSIRRAYPEEYVRYSAVQSEDQDIFVAPPDEAMDTEEASEKDPLKTEPVKAPEPEVNKELTEHLEENLSAILSHLEEQKSWDELMELYRNTDFVKHHNIVQIASVVALNETATCVDGLKKKLAEKLFFVLVDLSATCQSSDVLVGCRNVLANISVTPDMIVTKLAQIWGPEVINDPARKSGRGGRMAAAPKEASDGSDGLEAKWLKTDFLLELSLAEKSASGTSLLPPLFSLLKRAVNEMEFHGDRAYSVNLALSCMHDVISNLSLAEAAALQETSVNPELLVQCIRHCKSPDSKNLALLILAKASAYNTEYIMQNCIQIFTFMGSHFLHMDSRSSFDVACQAIDIIIPHILKVGKAKKEQDKQNTVLSILTTFVDASLDMAKHRFKTFLNKLVKCLGEREYLWILTLLLLKTVGKKKDNSKPASERMSQIQDLYSAFPVRAQVEALLRMMVNLKQDSPALRKLLSITDKKSSGSPHKPEMPEELDLLRLRMLNFVSTLLASTTLSHQLVANLKEGDDLQQELRLLVECAILNVEAFEKAGSGGDAISARVRKYLLQQCEKVLEGALGVVPSEVLLSLLKSLLSNEHEAVRRKTLEVLNTKLQMHSDDAVKRESEALLVLLEPLVVLAQGRVPGGSDPEVQQLEGPANQLLALMALRTFGRRLGHEHSSHFVPVCSRLAKKSFLRSLTTTNMKASAVLCLVEVFDAVGPRAVTHLPPLADWLLEVMTQIGNVAEESRDGTLLLNSVILAVQKLMDHFSGFLHPYFERFVLAVCHLGVARADRQLAARLKSMQSAIAAAIPTHSLVSICQPCFDHVMDQPAAIAALMNIIRENVGTMSKSQALAGSTRFVEFFQYAFKFRQRTSLSDLKQIARVEDDIIAAFMGLMLKLSLDEFKPLLYRLFNLTVESDGSIDGTITVFHVMLEVAKTLKSLFDFVGEVLVQRSTTILADFVSDDFGKLKKLSREDQATELFVFILDTLTTIFTYNKIETVLAKNYEELVNAILSFLEYPFEEQENAGVFFEKVTTCLTQLATSSEDETQWKYLNYQTLLNLRSNNTKVRSTVLCVISNYVDVKGENYLSDLPECVPFLSETLEDDDHDIETSCRKLIKKMEETFGRSIEDYFD